MFCNQYKETISLQAQQLNEQQAVLKALDRVMGVIEFDLQGNILDVNANFLSVVKYDRESVVGKHHSMFAPPGLAGSEEYKKFWEKLGAGQFEQGRFKRIDSQGNDVWIEASYNPILDENNNPVKVIKFATEITDQVEKELDAKGQIEAINKTMAVIEFDLEGNILKINPNFEEAMGYTAEEVVGQHHRIFGDKELVDSEAYKQFWAELAQGQAKSGTYPRRRKDGSRIWLEASYNPILDEKGQPIKVVKYATDLSSNEATQYLTYAIRCINTVLAAMAQGDLTSSLEMKKSSDAASMFAALIDELRDNLSGTIDGIKNALLQTRDTVENAQAEIHAVMDKNKVVLDKANAQSSSIDEIASSLEQMTASVQQTSDNSQQANQLSSEARTKATEGERVMNDTIQAMQHISESSDKISDIITLIDSIAFQTNLLALNAAVEAARAGDHGRGFAVVAGEVRALAGKSADAAKDIKVLIENTVDQVESGTRLVNESGESLKEINTSIKKVADIVSEISAASVEQAHGISQVNQAMAHMDNSISAMMDENTQSVDIMKHQVHLLGMTFNYFKVEEGQEQFSPDQPPKRKAIQTQQGGRSGQLKKGEWSEF